MISGNRMVMITTDSTTWDATSQMSDDDVLRIALCIPPMEGGTGATAIHKFSFGHELFIAHEK